MSDRRRARATWLLLAVLTSTCLGICTTVLTASGDKLACCADLGDGQASFTACCGTGEQSPSSDLPEARAAVLPDVVFTVTPRITAHLLHQSPAIRSVPPRSADPQALLSTFLI
jgi:hypothetical protein